MAKCRILSYDLGKINHGLALFHFDESYIKLIKSKYIQTNYDNFGSILIKINDLFEEIINSSKPDLFIYEKPVFKKGDNACYLNQVLGVITLSMFKHEIPMYPYSATEVKKTICQNGKAGKKEVERCVNEILNIDYKYERDHEADAVAIGLTHWIKEIKSYGK